MLFLIIFWATIKNNVYLLFNLPVYEAVYLDTLSGFSACFSEA